MFVSSVTAILLVGAARSVQADECDKLTYVTVSAPVTLPGVTLPVGTYRFTHPACSMSSHLLRVSSQNGSEVDATLLAIPEDRLRPTDEPVVIFEEMPARAPEAIKALFYPGETVGDKLIYPKRDESVADGSPIRR
jgi:hypothetical protein